MVGSTLERLCAEKQRKTDEKDAKAEAAKTSEAARKEAAAVAAVQAQPFITRLMSDDLPLNGPELAARGTGVKMTILKAILLTLGGKCDGKKEDVAKKVVELIQTRKANATPRDASGSRHGLGGGGAAGVDGAAAGVGLEVKLIELPDIMRRVEKLLEPSAANLPKLCDTHGRALAKSAHYFIHQGHYIFGGFCRDWIGRGKIWPSADLDVSCSTSEDAKAAIVGFKAWLTGQNLVVVEEGTKGPNVTWVRSRGDTNLYT